MSASEAPLPKTRKRHRIGVFVDWLADGYSDPILDEVTRVALANACDVVCYVGGLPEERVGGAHRLPLHFASKEVIDAVLVVSLGNSFNDDEIAEALAHLAPLPMVSVAVQWSKYPSVEVSVEAGVRRAVRHLIRAHGRRRIACLRGPLTSSEAELRFRAYLDALQEQGLPFDPAIVAVGNYTRPSGVETVRRWLDVERITFDAVVAANDAMALGVMEELQERDIRVPGQVALVGFDDIDQASHCRPALTTVRQPVRAHARAAFEVLLQQLKGEQVPLKTYVQAELVVRRSCGCSTSTANLDSLRPSSKPPAPELDASTLGYLLKPVTDFFGRAELSAAAPALLQCFSRAVVDGERTEFLQWLEAELESVIVQRDILTFAHALRELKERAAARPVQGITDKRLADLVVEATSLVGEVACAAQASQRYRNETRFVDLVRTNETLLSSVDLATLSSALGKNLDRFRIPSLFVCLYAGAGGAPQLARLVVGCRAGSERQSFPQDQFPAAQVLPAQLWPAERPYCLLVCPLLRSQNASPGYVVFERGVPEGFVYDGLLDEIGSTFNRIRLLEQLVQHARMREIAERERLESELRIASNIQTGILPRLSRVDGLELAATMLPATEVGGDYYDILPFDGGCWLGIGDVAGHGLPTGLVMLMLQSVVSGLVRVNPNAEPREIIVSANSVLVDNIRHRMGQDEHVTLALIRYESDGRFFGAGAHEDVIICRAADGSIERIETSGLWVGIVDDIDKMTDSFQGELSDGDLLVLYTDGVTEAQNGERAMFGVSRLADAVRRYRALPVSAIRDAIIEELKAWMVDQRDDITLLVARQHKS